MQRNTLKKKGKVYVEINENYGHEVRELFRVCGFEVSILQDLNGKDRIVEGDILISNQPD